MVNTVVKSHVIESSWSDRGISLYELMVKTNHALIQGDKLTAEQKTDIVRSLMTGRSTQEQATPFHRGHQCRSNVGSIGRHMVPSYFIPPNNEGKKYKTILGQTPKTQIFSANMYELEILRLLYLFDSENCEIETMVSQTLKRLKTTCFGFEDDGLGECFDASLVVLRFLAAAAPSETEWIQSRINNYNRHNDEKKRPWFSKWYYWLCLSELSFDIAKPEIDTYKSEMLHWLTDKSCVMNSEQDQILHPVLLCILRNCLCQYKEYEYIKDRLPFVNEKDNRLYFDMSKRNMEFAGMNNAD